MPLPIFPYFPALRTLVIVYPLWLEIPWAPQLARLLTQLTQHRLDTLTLILIAQFENSLYERGEHLPADWIPLDAQVARMRPREVIVQVHPNSGKGERVEGLEVIENGLPHTAASCILRVERLSGKCSSYTCMRVGADGGVGDQCCPGISVSLSFVDEMDADKVKLKCIVPCAD